MQIMVRLYRQHDLDLIGLYKTEGFSFQKELKAALVAYSNGDNYQISRPDNAIPEGYVPKVIQMHISLNGGNEKEQTAIKLLKTMKTGMRNSFLKAVFRSHLSSIPLASYKTGDGLILTKETPFFEEKKESIDNTKSKSIETKSVYSEKSDYSVLKEAAVEEKMQDADSMAQHINHVEENTKDVRISQNTKQTYDESNADDDGLMDIFEQMSSLAH